MTNRIGIIATYNSLAEISKEIVLEFDEDIRVFEGNFNECVQLASKLQMEGFEAFISEKTTAAAIRDFVQIPVIDIQIDDEKLLEVLYRESLQNGKLAIVADSRIIYEKETLEELLKIKIVEYVYNESAEVNGIVDTIKKSNIKTVLGGIQVVDTANKAGLKGVLLENGKEAIIRAIKEAKNIVEVRRTEQYRVKYLQSILNYSQEGIIAIDENDTITLINPVAAEVFGLNADEVLGKKAADLIPNTMLKRVVETATPELGKLQIVNSKTTIVVNRVPVTILGKVIGAVSTFENITKVQELEKRIRHDLISKGHYAKYTFEDLIGDSISFVEARIKGIKYACTDSTVLITGESGTGKEMFAHSIHNASRRSQGPFIAINCAAIPESLLESELFGYEEGAFTDAKKGGKQGLFTLAHGGTIFLDEIDSINGEMQVSLLRVLQEKEIRPVGSNNVIPIDCRVIAATNANMKKKVEKGEFRDDLYYRLNVLRINIPPLRERREDIEKLISFMMTKSKNKFMKKISPNAMSILKKYHWPGNVRELENVIERLLVEAGAEDSVTAQVAVTALEDAFLDNADTLELSLNGTLDEMKKKIVSKMLERNGGNKTIAAKKLGISRVHLGRIEKIIQAEIYE